MPSADTHASPLPALDDLVGNEAHVLLGHRIVERTADQSLDGEEGALGIGHRLALGRLADQALAVVGERDDRGRGARAFRVLDHLGGCALHDRDAGIGCSQVYADNFSHCSDPHVSRDREAPKRPRLEARPAPCGASTVLRSPMMPINFALQTRRLRPHAA